MISKRRLVCLAAGAAVAMSMAPGAVMAHEETLKMNQLFGNHTEFAEPLNTSTFIFAVNKAKYESLSDELKAAIDSQSGEAFSALAGKMMEVVDGPGREAAVKNGNNIITLSAEETQAWKDAAAGVEGEWIEEMNNLGFDGKALREEAKALIAKNSM